MFEDYLIVYAFGMATPYLLKYLVIPQIKKYLKERWIGEKKQNNKREPCEECGSTARHKKSCSHAKKS